MLHRYDNVQPVKYYKLQYTRLYPAISQIQTNPTDRAPKHFYWRLSNCSLVKPIISPRYLRELRPVRAGMRFWFRRIRAGLPSPPRSEPYPDSHWETHNSESTMP